ARFSQKGASKRFSDRPRMAAMPGVPRAAGARCDITLRSLHTRPGVIAPLLKFTLIRASRKDRLRSRLARKVPLTAARRGGYMKQRLRLGQPQAYQTVEGGVIGEELRGGAGMHDAAAFEDECGLGERQRDVGVLLDQDEGALAFLRHAADRGGELFDHDRRQTLERLIEQKQRRVGHQ